MGIKRIGRHLIEHRWRVRRVFPARVLDRIEQAIKAGEATHSEINPFAAQMADLVKAIQASPRRDGVA